MSEVLADGTTVADRRFDRLVQFDQRSRSFPIRELVPKKPRSYTWRCPVWLDQGREGACVGFAVAHELIARPAVVKTVDDTFARKIYREAQKNDPWPGEDYEGTSVLAGIKAAHAWGYFKSYRWVFGLEDLILGVGYCGPAVGGFNWHEGMFYPDKNGLIKRTGQLLGGHAVAIVGVHLKTKVFRIHQSWGTSHGQGGDVFLSFDDMNRLLHEQGEACIPVERIAKPKET